MLVEIIVSLCLNFGFQPENIRVEYEENRVIVIDNSNGNIIDQIEVVNEN